MTTIPRLGWAVAFLAACDDSIDRDGPPRGGPPAASHEDPPDDGDPPAAEGSVAEVWPAEVYPGRSVRVEITGDGTDWTDGPVVTFGEGIAVGPPAVTSATSISVSIEVAADAPFGPRDVRVDGLVAVAALDVVAPVALSFEGTPAQGTVLFLDVENLDVVPFDVTVGEDPASLMSVFTDLDVVAPAGVHVLEDVFAEHSGGRLSLNVYVDVGFPAGPLELQMTSGRGAAQTVFRLPTLDIAAREAVPLEEGVPVDGALIGARETALYGFGPAERAILQLSSVPSAEGTRPQVMMLEPDGAFGPFGLWDSPPFLASAELAGAVATGPVYGIVIDYSGASGVDFTMTGRSALLGSATVAETAGPNDAMATAQPVVLPVTVTDAAIEYAAGSGFGEDWFEVVIGPDDAGRSLGAATFGPGFTDPVLEVWGDDGATLVAVADTVGFGVNYHECLFTGPLAAGTYHVRVSTNDYAQPESGAYSLALALTD